MSTTPPGTPFAVDVVAGDRRVRRAFRRRPADPGTGITQVDAVLGES